MNKTIEIIIKNELRIEKREMNIYHHFARGSHLISHNSSISIDLYSVLYDDYLFISLVSGPGKLEHQHTVDLPSWINYELNSEGKLTARHIENRTLLIIPPGLPEWKIKLTRPVSHSLFESKANIIIKENLGE
jgi:hypothetical protein